MISLHTRVNSVRLEGLLKGVDSICDFISGLLKFLFGDDVELLSLAQLEFKFLGFTVSLALLVFLPVFDSLLVPFLHESCIALELVDLNAAHFLKAHA